MQEWTPEEMQPQLIEKFPLAGVRLAEDFFSVKREDFYKGIYVVSSEIESGKKGDFVSTLRIRLRFTKESHMWQYFAGMLPEPETVVLFEGKLYSEYEPPHFEVTGEYLKEVSLPFLNGSLKTTRCRLTLISHTEDFYDFSQERMNGKTSYMSQAVFAGAYDLFGMGISAVWLTEELYKHGQKFVVSAEFDPGLTIGSGLALIAALSGQKEGMDLPDWLSVDRVKLTNLALSMKKETYEGVSVFLELTLPKMPIPFFSDTDKPTVISLMLEWDLLSISAVPAIINAFKSTWNGYCVNLNMDIMNLSFIGRLYRDAGEKYSSNDASMIFPGFSGLVLSDLRVVGDIPEVYYQVEVTFSNSKAQKLPLSGRLLDIDWIDGYAYYTSEGIGLGIHLRVIFLEAILDISGSYTSGETGKILTLEGGLKSPISLLSLISYLLDTDIGGSTLDLTIEELSLRYVADFSENQDVFTESSVQNFLFSVGFAFTWEAVALKVKTFCFIDWSKEREGGYFISLSAEVNFLGFTAKALCDIVERQNELFLERMRFELFMAGLDLVAQVQKKEEHEIIYIEIKTMNLGIMLEALVDMIIPGTNWYLPWPFGVLKQLTLRNITITIDNTTGYVKVEYKIDLHILVLHIKSIVLEYGDGRGEDEEHFTVTLDIGMVLGEERELLEGAESYGMDFLKGLYPSIPSLGDSILKLRYLAIGQRVKITVPKNFDESGIADVLDQLKKQIKKDGVPTLDLKNNWVAALQLKLMNSIDVSVLLCDPSIYGLELTIGSGCDMTKALAGLKLIILYSKVTDTIGMFYARLSLPEAFRRIELGAVQIQLGEVSIAIYTNGDFKVDLGFPHGGDFSRSFGLTYLIFGGKGGFYLGLLHGVTSSRVPKVESGHFDTVLELGLGISAGLSREFSFGPVRFGAAVQMVGIFEGVIAQYVPEEKNGEDATYFWISAMAGVTAYVYGEVDFVLLKISFSVHLSISVNLTIESYRKTLLALHVSVMVRAYIKILFIKIKFSFEFKWDPSFVLGEDTVAPWERRRILKEKINAEYHLNWENSKVFQNPKEIQAMLVPFASKEGIVLNWVQGKSISNRITILPLFSSEEPFTVLVEGMLRRCCLALSIGNEIPVDGLEWLLQELSKEEILHTGFALESLEKFFAENIHVYFLPWEQKDVEEEQGIPFPIPPLVTAYFKEEGGEKREYNLAAEPMVTDAMLKEMETYYAMLRPVGTGMRKNKNLRSEAGYSMTEYLFCDYFHMLAKTVVGQALQQYKEEETELSIDELVVRVLKEEILASISGFVSKSVLGGMRFPYKVGSFYETESVFTFAGQQYDVLGSEVTCEYSLWKQAESPWFFLWVEGAKADKLHMSLTKKDVVFPSSSMDVQMNVGILPFYEKQQELIELKSPIEIVDEPLCRIYDVREGLPEEYMIVTYDEGEEKILSVEQHPVIKIHVPLTKSGKNSYSIGCLSKDAAKSLDGLLTDQVTDVKVYRTANAPGEPGSGLVPIQGELFLYRQNLSVEAEKPLVLHAEESAEPVEDELLTSDTIEVKNSAWLKVQKGMFLQLLRDAALVNSRGYYLMVSIPEEALQEGYAEITLLLNVEEAGSIMLLYEKEEDIRCHPVVKSTRTYEEEIYKPGHTGIFLDPEESETFLSQPFQMLCTQVVYSAERESTSQEEKAVETFTVSNASLPVTPLIQEDCGRFLQVLPLYRCFTGKENPYGGILSYKNVGLRFALLDVAGNKTSSGLFLEVPLGYTDALESPSSYPNTKGSYRITAMDREILIEVTLVYKKGEDGIKKEETELAKTAYYQLLQEDVTLELTGLRRNVRQDKKALLAYLKELAEGREPENAVSFFMTLERPAEVLTPLEVGLLIRRDTALVSPLIVSEDIRKKITLVTAPLPPREEEITDSNIVKQSSTGELYYLNLPEWELPKVSTHFALPPLSQKLISIQNLLVHTLAGEEAEISYSDIDIECWADTFFKDVEQVLAPDSPLSFTQEELEKMLEIKEGFAIAISACITSITESGEGEDTKSKAAAESFLKERLKQNLYLGRNLSALSVYQSSAVLFEKQAYIGIIEDQHNHVVLSPGKIRPDKKFVVGIECDDIHRQWKVQKEAVFRITDVEVSGEGMPCYYSYLSPKHKTLALDAPVPSRYIPSLPRMMKHQDLPSEELLSFDYRFEVSHETAAQDTIHMVVQLDSAVKRQAGDFLKEAFGQYIYLREEILAGKEGAEAAMIDASQKILLAWGRKSRSSFLEDGLKFAFSVDMNQGEFLLQEGENLVIEMLGESGEWLKLVKNGKKYVVPADVAKHPFAYRFTLQKVPLAVVHNINTRCWVMRNQLIPDIKREFVCHSEEVNYPSSLRPRVVYQEERKMGAFEIGNFKDQIKTLSKGFGDVAIQVSCGRLIQEGETSYLWLPVLFLPNMKQEELDKKLELAFSETKRFMREKLSEKVRDNAVVGVHLTLFDDSHTQGMSLNCSLDSEVARPVRHGFNGVLGYAKAEMERLIFV